jgi:hypothetical protein
MLHRITAEADHHKRRTRITASPKLHWTNSNSYSTLFNVEK